MKKSIIIATLLLLTIAFPMLPSYSTEPTVKLASEGDAYIIVFGGWKLPKNVEALIEGCGGTVMSKWAKIGALAAMPDVDPAIFEEALSQRPEIVKFGPDYVMELPDDLTVLEEIDEFTVEGSPTVEDPYYWVYQWHMWHTIDASPMGAWQITTGDPDIKVAICDTGIDWNHPDLAPNYDSSLSMSFVPYEDAMDYDGHGSWCAGTVAAAINNDPNDAKCVGVGPDLTLVNLKVLDGSGSGDFYWLIDAVYYAACAGIDVVSMSLGAYLPFCREPYGPGAVAGLYTALERVFSYARQNGVVCVASAGNSYVDMDMVHPWIHLPSQCSNVICVIGTNIYDELAYDPGIWGSNWGSCLHGISAPGGDAALVEPEWYKETIPPEYWNPVYGYVFSCTSTETGYMYAWAGGTSMSAPQVAGVAGLILSVNPNLNPSQVEHFLQKGAEDIGPPGYDEYFNFGLLNAYNSVLEASRLKIRHNSGAFIVP